MRLSLNTISRTIVTAAMVLMVATGLLTATPATTPPAQAATNAPCDIYAAGGTACAAAYSTTRALYAGYSGPLYQVTRASGGAIDIGLTATGGYAAAWVQDNFCAGTTCTITKVYDQSPNNNHLTIAPGGGQGTANKGANATALPLTIAGHRAYGLYLPPGYAYRLTDTTGIPVGKSPESIYAVLSGTNVNAACCAGFGNVERDASNTDTIKKGHMHSVLVSLWGGAKPNSVGNYGPWVQADLELGLLKGANYDDPNNKGNNSKFVTAMSKVNDNSAAALQFSIAGGNAQSGALTHWYEGKLAPDYQGKMALEGSISLGAGGDNSNRGTSSFFEGAIINGYASAATEDAVHNNIVAQSYQAEHTGGGPGNSMTMMGSTTWCVDTSGDDLGGVGAAVQLWGCKPLAADQKWTGSIYGIGSIGTLGLCMAPANNATAAGTRIVLAQCNGSAIQQWIPQGNGSLVNKAANLCLDLAGGNLSNGTPMQLWSCNNEWPQKFTTKFPVLYPFPGGSAMCMDVLGVDNVVEGAWVVLWGCQSVTTGGENGHAEAQDQQWTYHPNTQALTAMGKCLSTTFAGADGKAIMQTCNGSANQKWLVDNRGWLVHATTGLCLDSPNGSQTFGTQLRLWGCNGAPAQQFRLNYRDPSIQV